LATLGQNRNRNLLKGLSSFWNRFFKDKELLQNFYSATDQLMGQLYLELLELLLANSIKSIPVFSKEFWKLMTFDSTKVEIEGSLYKFKLEDKIRELKFVYNKIFEPSIIMENNKDYYIEGEYIYFYKNIFDDLEYAGLAKRRQGNATIISLWAPEASIDKEYIYENYGRMLKIYEASSEDYKAFIKGIWFYYMNGPTVNRITSALNIIGGYPVAEEDGEIVLSIKTINDINYIKTTTTTYEIDANIELNVSVGDTLQAFQFLTNAYTVTDYIDDPTWYDHIVVPIEIIPDATVIERTTNKYDPDPLFIGYPILIGDPRWRIGMGGLPNFMWLFFNQVLKYNIFYVSYDAQASKFVRSDEDLIDIVLSGKPSFDYALTVPYNRLVDETVDSSEEAILIEGEMELANTYSYADLDEELLLNLDLIVSEDPYGGIPITFLDAAARIGAGVIGDEDARVASGVPVLIGTNTLGRITDGLYTEFPLEIFVE